MKNSVPRLKKALSFYLLSVNRFSSNGLDFYKRQLRQIRTMFDACLDLAQVVRKLQSRVVVTKDYFFLFILKSNEVYVNQFFSTPNATTNESFKW